MGGRVGEDRLVALRQRIELFQVGEGVDGRTALPEARIVVVLGDLGEAELLVIVGADPFGGIDGALLQRRIDVAAGELLRHHADLLQHLAGNAADAHLEARQVGNGLDYTDRGYTDKMSGKCRNMLKNVGAGAGPIFFNIFQQFSKKEKC